MSRLDCAVRQEDVLNAPQAQQSRKGRNEKLEAERNFIAVVGNAQVDSSITIGSKGGIDIEHVERNRARDALNVDGETVGGKHKPLALEPLATGQNEDRGRQRLGDRGTGDVRDLNDLRRRQGLC